MDQNHLGKFLKLSSLESPTIEYQLFNFGKESLKQIFLNSKCGEIINGKEFKDKPSNSNLVGTKNIYPLSCLYKKAKPKINPSNNIYHWKENRIKKKVDILSNAYMSLSLLTLAEYYNEIIKDEKIRKEVVKFYVSSVKCQLNFYINNFRNELGLFVDKNVKEREDDKKHKKENFSIQFESLNDSFDFPAQAYLMISFLKCSNMLKETSPYKIPFLKFSEEIEKMFLDFKDNILKIKTPKLIELLQAFEIYVPLKPDLNIELLNLILDIIEILSSKNILSYMRLYDKIILYKTLLNLKSYLNNFKDYSKDIYNSVCEHLWEVEEFFSLENIDKNEINDSYDLISYQIYISNINKEEAHNFYNNVLLPSKIFSCFPNIPKKYEGERYFKFDHNEKYLIPDKFFKPNSYKTMDEINITPIICKDVYYLRDKHKFSKPKLKFNSLLNMRLIFFILYNLKNTIIKTMK